MSHQIIKQPNGKYCTFSSIVDHVIFYNATPEEIINGWVEKARKKVTEDVNRAVEMLKNNERPYLQFTMSFDEMIETIKEQHGEDSVKEIISLINKDE